MNLRVTILLGYGYLIALVLVVACSALLGFFHLSAGIDDLLEENFASIRVSMEMVESLERQDSETLAALVGRGDGDGEAALVEEAGARMEKLDQEFLSALKRCEDNISEAEEPAILQAVRRDWERYRAAREKLLEARPESPLAAYNKDVFPLFSAVKSDVSRLLAVNQEAMVRADRDAKSTAVRNSAWMGFLVAIALVSLAFLARTLQGNVLSRLEELLRGLTVIAEEETHRRLHIQGNDELTVIARKINTLLDVHQKSAARTNGLLSAERQLILGLVGALPSSALFNLNGAFVAGADLGRPEEIRAWINGAGDDHVRGGEEDIRETLSVGGEDLELRLLCAGRRPVGWLVSRPGV